MIRALLTAATLSLLLSACSDPQPTAVSKPPKPAAQPAVVDHSEPVSPTLASVFIDGPSCEKAKFTKKQCDDAWGVSNSMAQATPATYSSEQDCKKYFRRCEERPGKGAGGDAGFAPVMAGFSVGDEQPGVDRKPTAEHPQWYAPVYRDVQGRWVYLLQDKNNKLMAVPVTENPNGAVAEAGARAAARKEATSKEAATQPSAKKQ